MGPLCSSARISTQMIVDGGRIRVLFVSNCDLREGKSAPKLPVEAENCGAGPMSITASVRRRRFHESCSYLGQTACVSRGNLSDPLTIPLGASLWSPPRTVPPTSFPRSHWLQIPVVCDCCSQSEMALTEKRRETSKRKINETKETIKRRRSLKRQRKRG